jgi:hypothetical protein
MSDPQISEPLRLLLREERAALVSGNLEKLGALSERKQMLLNDLENQAIPQIELDALQKNLSRNQALLSSALDGIRAVASRMSDLQKARSGLETYDRSGTRARFETGQPQALEKRA